MKFFILGSNDLSLVNFRGPLIGFLARLGHEVVACAPPTTAGITEQVASLGGRFRPMPLARAGLNPFADVRSMQRIEAIVRSERPDVFLAYAIKPVVYGVPAARRAGVPRVYALVTGLGAAFYTPGWKGRVLQLLATWFYRRALPQCDKVLVQNDDIADLFVQWKMVAREKIVTVPGSGVDVHYFNAVILPSGPPVFLLLARMLRDKGVEEYVAAAQLVKKQIPGARFLLVGDTDPNPAAISGKQLELWNREGVVEYRSAVSDVRPLLSECTTYVLPSYHEGMPRSVLEAMATGRPVITTDAIGCRETIIKAGVADSESIRTGENGMLVPVRSIEPLATAMLRLAKDSNARKQMGQRGREIAEQQFDVRHINEQMLRLMGLLPNPAGARSNPLPQALSP